ncbi:hypothetical protein BH11PLA2_BH11PLA2_40130 [soil metagenome]
MNPSNPIPIVINHVDLAAENAALRMENASLRQKLTHAEAVIDELRTVVTELRQQVASQQIHIQRLVKMTFGGERIAGPTLFDTVSTPATASDASPPPVVEPPPLITEVIVKRKGHGRKSKPVDLPRRREEIDLTAAEKICACGTTKIRLGQTTSERLDYQPASLFVRELVRPTYVCRCCEQAGHPPQIAKAVLPPEPIPKAGMGSGLLAQVIVSKCVDHRVQGELSMR